MTEPIDEKERVYLEYYGKVRGYIGGKVDNIHDAEELTSEVFLKIYRKWETFDAAKASRSTWIYTVARNTVIDFFRTRRIYAEFMEDMTADESLAQDAARENALEALAWALARLSRRERDILILRYCKALTLKQIARMMDMSYSNCKILHAKALEKLRRLWNLSTKGEEQEPPLAFQKKR